MKNNIFTKSMLRQPIRTALIVLFMAFTSFSFVMRSAEYIIIDERINEIGEHFRAIGILNHMGDFLDDDVRQAADIVRESLYVSLSDSRRLIEAVLLDMPNAETLPAHHRNISRVARALRPRDAFFFGTLVDMQQGGDTYMVLSVEVDSVLVGYPEHVRAGQTLTVQYFMDVNEIRTGETAIDNMVVGQRYLLRGTQYAVWASPESESQFIYLDKFVMKPLSEVTYNVVERYFMERYLPRYGVWYVNAPPFEDVNLVIPGLENLEAELHWMRFAQSSVRMQTTADMTLMPLMRTPTDLRAWRAELVEGRFIDRDDYYYARPVVIVNDSFARIRGLEIGDILTIGILPEQRLTGSAGMTLQYIEVDVIGEVYAPLAHILELEIVGLVQFVGFTYFITTSWMYMPDSVLPSDVTIAHFRDDSEDGYISSEWYSFVLNDPRDVDAFLLENRETLEELGFTVEFMPSIEGAREFWESVEGILQSVVFNLVLFSVISVLVLTLISFLYNRQRQKDFAISRALGSPERKTLRQLLTAFLLVALPSIIAGGLGGWFMALNAAANAVDSLGGGAVVQDVSDYMEYGQTVGVNLSIFWMFALIAVVFAGLLVLMLFLGLRMSRRPVLELLQGKGR